MQSCIRGFVCYNTTDLRSGGPIGNANLRILFERFEVRDLPQNKKRIRLAELAVRSGVVSPRDLDRRG